MGDVVGNTNSSEKLDGIDIKKDEKVSFLGSDTSRICKSIPRVRS